MLRANLFVSILTISISGFAQVIDNTSSVRMMSSDTYVRLHYENDYFSKSDQYYTQGMNLEFVSKGLKKNPLNIALFIPKNDSTLFGLAIEHNAYTSTSIRSKEILYGDRPFAASIIFKTFSSSFFYHHRLRVSSSFSLGMIGSIAGAEQIQRTIHRWINYINPQGWQFQIKNDLIINYETGLEKNIIHSSHFLLNGLATLRAGTYNTKASIGASVLWGKLNPAIQNSFSGKIQNNPKQKFFLHWYTQPIFNAVAYDATLQGGMVFNRNSPYTLSSKELKHFTFQTNTGIVVSIGSFNIEYFQSMISSEFHTGQLHHWGGIRLGLLL
jgi:lipid A 3-O-deacylase